MTIRSISSSGPKTLRELMGGSDVPSPLSKSVLIIIDAQKEYQDGLLPLAGFQTAIMEIEKLLKRARAAGIPVIHVVHKGQPGSKAFDPSTRYVDIVDALTPREKEVVVEKHFPNSFTQTTLEAELEKTGRKDLVIVGFMAHMCISSTTRGAAEKGYGCTVVANGCATRDLPDANGAVVDAATLQAANLAALNDRFAIVVPSQDCIPD